MEQWEPEKTDWEPEKDDEELNTDTNTAKGITLGNAPESEESSNEQDSPAAHPAPHESSAQESSIQELSVRKPLPQDFAVKAYLVLVDSDKEDWGMVEDTMNDILWTPGKGETVGTWTRAKYDNLIHISVGTALSALQDRSIQTFKVLAEQRIQAKTKGTTATRRKKTTGATEAAEETTIEKPALSVDDQLKFNDLRARLGRTK